MRTKNPPCIAGRDFSGAASRAQHHKANEVVDAHQEPALHRWQGF